MKKRIIIAGLLIFFMVLGIWAGPFGYRKDGERDRTSFRGQQRGNMQQDIAGRFLERLDKDGDGELSESEIDVLRNMMRERKERRGKGGFGNIPPAIIRHFDTDGDGELSEAERKTFEEYGKEKMKKVREEHLQKYDKDGDGRLSREERKVLMETERENIKRLHEEFISAHDSNGNGEIDKEEVDALSFEQLEEYAPLLMGKRMKDRRSGQKNNRKEKGPRIDPVVREYHLMRYDTDKNGRIEGEEREAVSEEFNKYRERFDEDGDGRLSVSEREQLQDFLKKIAEEYLDTRDI